MEVRVDAAERSATRGVRGWVRRHWERRPWAPPAPPDPFAALAVQLRLGRLAGEIARLQAPEQEGFARMHHLKAAVSAYDRLLGDACAMAGVPQPEGTDSVRRLLQEAELRARGWSW